MNVTRRVSAGTSMNSSFYEAALDLLPHPVVVCSANDLLIVYANNHATSELKLLRPEMAGEGEFVGESIESFLPGVVVQCQALFDLDCAQRHSIRLIGQTREISVRKLFGEPDTADLLIITWSPIAERDATTWIAEVANGDSEAHGRIAKLSIDEAADAVFWIREDGSFAYFNEAACHMLGYSRGDMTKLTVMDIDPKCTREAWADAWANMEVGNRRVYEWFQQTKNGRDLPVEISSNVLEFGGHRYNVSSVRDISD